MSNKKKHQAAEKRRQRELERLQKAIERQLSETSPPEADKIPQSETSTDQPQLSEIISQPATPANLDKSLDEFDQGEKEK